MARQCWLSLPLNWRFYCERCWPAKRAHAGCATLRIHNLRLCKPLSSAFICDSPAKCRPRCSWTPVDAAFPDPYERADL